jgi:hypothetical protein
MMIFYLLLGFVVGVLFTVFMLGLLQAARDN